MRRLLITVIMVCKSEDPREQFDDESRRQDKHIYTRAHRAYYQPEERAVQKMTEKDESDNKKRTKEPADRTNGSTGCDAMR